MVYEGCLEETGTHSIAIKKRFWPSKSDLVLNASEEDVDHGIRCWTSV